MEILVVVVLVISGLIVLDIAALLWGANSCEGVDSQEWQRRAAGDLLGANG